MKYTNNNSYERNYCPAERRKETIFNKVCNYSALLENTQRCKRKVSYKNSVARFDMYVLSKTYELYLELENGTYNTEEGQTFEIFEPKHRVVTATKIKDRVVQSTFVLQVMYPQVVTTLIENNCSCLKGKGVEFARNKLKEILKKSCKNDYILKIDLKDYFGSIDHDVLAYTMRKYFGNEKWVNWYYRNVINSNHKNVGIGLGSEINQLSAVALLNQIDHALDTGKYLRYMDDIIFISYKENCEHIRNMFISFVNSLKLQISLKKTYIQPITRPVSFLGFTFYIKGKRITLKRIKTKLNNEKRKLRRMFKLKVPLNRIKIHYESVRSNMKKGTRSGVVKLDKYFDDMEDKYGT